MNSSSQEKNSLLNFILFFLPDCLSICKQIIKGCTSLTSLSFANCTLINDIVLACLGDHLTGVVWSLSTLVDFLRPGFIVIVNNIGVHRS